MWLRFVGGSEPGPLSDSYFAVVMIADISGFTKLTHWLDENIKNGQVRPGGRLARPRGAPPNPTGRPFLFGYICIRSKKPCVLL